MARIARARTRSAEVERVRALLNDMTGHSEQRPAGEARTPAGQSLNGRGDAEPETLAAGSCRRGKGDATSAVTAWATLPEASPSSTFEVHARRSSGTITWEPASAEEAASCEESAPVRSEAVEAVAAFLETLGKPASRPSDGGAASDSATSSHRTPARPRRGTTRVPVSVARAFGQERRTFASPDAFDEALARCAAQCAWKRLLSMTGARERSAAHIERALVDEGFSRDVARDAVQRARTCQLVDDARFAETFIRAKLRAGWGRQRIERALAQEGVDATLAPGYPEEYFDAGDEERRAWEALLRKPVPARNPEQKLARFLAGRGFSPGLALRLARRRVEEANELA